MVLIYPETGRPGEAICSVKSERPGGAPQGLTQSRRLDNPGSFVLHGVYLTCPAGWTKMPNLLSTQRNVRLGTGPAF
jgi:hypothetical protein